MRENETSDSLPDVNDDLSTPSSSKKNVPKITLSSLPRSTFKPKITLSPSTSKADNSNLQTIQSNFEQRRGKKSNDNNHVKMKNLKNKSLILLRTIIFFENEEGKNRAKNAKLTSRHVTTLHVTISKRSTIRKGLRKQKNHIILNIWYKNPLKKLVFTMVVFLNHGVNKKNQLKKQIAFGLKDASLWLSLTDFTTIE